TDASVDDRTPPQAQVDGLSGVEMLERLATLFGKYPPHADDYPLLFRVRALGLVPGEPFKPNELASDVKETIDAAAKDALADLKESLSSIGRFVDGWTIMTTGIGTYGTSYRQRAAIAMAGLGANVPEDAIYPTAFVDRAGQPLNGANRYVLHFDKGKTPPAD